MRNEDIVNLISRVGNPQEVAMKILRDNPNFEKAIQGQDPKTLAMQELRKRGIDPNMIMRLINRR